MAISAGDIVRASHAASQNCRVTRSASLSVADNSFTTVPFDVEVFDTDTMHDNSTNPSRITFNTAGVYVVGFNAQFELGNDYIYVRYVIDLNGSGSISFAQFSGTGANVSQSGGTNAIYQFEVGDYIEARVEQNNTANTSRNLQLAGAWSPTFYAARVGG